MKIAQLLIFMFVFFIAGSAVGIFLFQDHDSASKSQNALVETKVNQNFSLKINQSAKIKSENVTITLLNVSEDSRCPQGGTCIGPGQVKVKLKFSKNGKIRKFTLISPASVKKLNQKKLGKYQIKLRSVKPYPQVDKTYKLEEYEVNMIIIN
ncbi:hypothetical protein [Methanobacterium alcaliphilum]|uniref:hypothetical protein n=1 Tax=Methanobacterium alcaliphilum TaxID=392018 RepID=UPI00200A22B5|nr:hypothetical protein [Methanobacterium alcaliphilum]MCK9150965.1 hypothetical protein [Methanobacterium alcaliphilum]